MRPIDADKLRYSTEWCVDEAGFGAKFTVIHKEEIDNAPTLDVEPVRRGEWVLVARSEFTNWRWGVTAECSECSHSIGTIWRGFFPDVPDAIANGTALESAHALSLNNYCPNCGAKMRA